MNNYEDYKTNIKSGDVLFFTGTGVGSTVDQIYSKIIRTFTSHSYHHVGVALAIGGRYFIVEAIPPLIRIYPLSKKGDFYHVETDIQWSDTLESKLLSYVGNQYSFKDAFLSYFSKPKDNGEWQCVEMTKDFLCAAGIYTGESYIPGELAETLMGIYGGMSKISNPI